MNFVVLMQLGFGGKRVLGPLLKKCVHPSNYLCINTIPSCFSSKSIWVYYWVIQSHPYPFPRLISRLYHLVYSALIFTGGLTAVIYTDTLCTFLMVTGSLTVMGLGNKFCLPYFKIKVRVTLSSQNHHRIPTCRFYAIKSVLIQWVAEARWLNINASG